MLLTTLGGNVYRRSNRAASGKLQNDLQSVFLSHNFIPP